MILIIGGQSQGKRLFAERLNHQRTAGLVCAKNADIRIADGRGDDYQCAFDADMICHLELYIRRLMKSGENPDAFIEQLMNQNGDAIVIADEIGYGIVPVDEFERNYRETDGRLCQKVAAASQSVYRVVCGIECKIK